MEYSKQSFEQKLHNLLVEYNSWKLAKARTSLQINTTKGIYSSEILKLFGAYNDQYRNKKHFTVIAGDFKIIDVEKSVPDKYIILELTSYSHYRLSSKFYSKYCEQLNIGDNISIKAILTGVRSSAYNNCIEWLLEHSSEYINGKKEKLFIVDLIDLRDKEGCYIATVCYDSYDAPEVKLLRKYRDEVLSKYYFGRLFIQFYYFLTPLFITLLSSSTVVKTIIKYFILTPIIKKLRTK